MNFYWLLYFFLKSCWFSITCARSSARQGSSVVAAIVGAITVDVAVAAGVPLFSLGAIYFLWKMLSFRLKSLRKLLVFIRNALISFGQHWYSLRKPWFLLWNFHLTEETFVLLRKALLFLLKSLHFQVESLEANIDFHRESLNYLK